MDYEILKTGMEELSLPVGEEILTKFGIYFDLLEERNKVMNLTAISGEADVSKLHFLDSLALTGHADFSGKKVIDVGSGAGFPGLPLKIAVPDMSLTMLDSLGKRVDFLNEVCSTAGISDAVAVHARAEEAGTKKEFREKYDFALSRAVARLNILCELCLPLVRPGGKFLAMKSTGTEDEINEANNAVKLLGGRIEGVYDYTVPVSDVIHRVIVIIKQTETPARYPRRFAKISKEPLR